ncbi:plasmid stabilization protein [Croceivirga lutea]|uniref:type II toxin-antitoxin system RelE/ParE family toxin n=1 Tax=Croceivirga lutea TaxID=1775167 RepID=UPI00163A82E6|nr:type II toxin-antitoxin system RelE/ParE family toxin [Croceivirga lutea]GGG42038.1 plasmid stabilization protein [Croceivirga lutea]
MAKFKLTNKAVADLNGIWEYTVEKLSENQADKYYREIMESCKQLAENPTIGKNYEGITLGLFGFKENKHIIFFRTLEKDLIEITRILHERMDLKNRLEE